MYTLPSDDVPNVVFQNDTDAPELRIVLLGRTGEGKSATGNTILGDDVFESSMSSISVTRGCQRGTCTRMDRFIQVIDTPGMYDTEMSIPDITREVVRCVGMVAPGPHVFLLILKPDRFTDEVKDTIDHLMKIFGEGMLKYLIILFTKKDELVSNGKEIENYVKEGSDKMKSLLQTCNNRYLAFNNNGTESEKEHDVRKLLAMTDSLVEENRGIYTSEMFQQAEMIMKEKEEQLRREHEECVERQLSQIRQECAKQLRTVEENYTDITRQLQKRLHDLERQETSTSRQHAGSVKKLLYETGIQHRAERRRIQTGADSRAQILTSQKVNFREKAREEAGKSSKFIKETLLPGMLKVAKNALPLLLSLGISLLIRFV